MTKRSEDQYVLPIDIADGGLTSRQRYMKRWREANRDKVLASSAKQVSRRRIRRRTDGERIRAVEKIRLARPEVQAKVQVQQDRYKRSVNGRYKVFVNKARRRNIANDLTLEQWLKLTESPCVYCGLHCLESTKNGYGVDRVDSFKAYTLDNCVACCGACNIMKHILSVDDFLAHVHRIAAYRERRSAA